MEIMARSLFLCLGCTGFLVIFDFASKLAALFFHRAHVGLVWVIAPFVVIADCLIRHILGVLDYVSGFFPCFFQNLGFLRIEIFFLLLQGFLQRFNFLFICLDCLFVLLHGSLACFEIREQGFHVDRIAVNLILCGVDDIIWQTKLACDGKCVGFTRNTDCQTISRTQSCHIKFARCIFYSIGGKGVCFQFAVMCRRHATGTHAFQII